MIGQRILSALVFIPALFVVIWFGNPWYLVAVAVVGLLGVFEFYGLLAQARWRPFTIFGAVCTLLFILGAADAKTMRLLMIGAVVFSLVWLLLRSKVENAFINWLWTLAGVFYLGWMLSRFVPLRELDLGREWVILTLFSTFATDTCAFLIGGWLGRHRLAPRISPGKTWEGAIGGLLGAVGATVALATLLGLPLGYGGAAVLGLVIGVFAQLGDLSESMLKRSVGVKQSGRLIPGHGGILDRLDSIVFTVVVVYYYVVWVIE